MLTGTMQEEVEAATKTTVKEPPSHKALDGRKTTAFQEKT